MYRRSQLIVILSPEFRAYLQRLGVVNEKIIDSISGVNKTFYPQNKDLTLLQRYQLQGQFVVGYIGTFGASHNHHDILAAASELKQDAIHFLMIGQGTKKEELVAQQLACDLFNVTIDGPFPLHDIPSYWALCDVAIVPLENTKTNTTVIPSKIVEAFAMGIPVILFAPTGAASQFLKKSQAGWHLELPSNTKLAQLINEISKDRPLLLEKKRNAIAFAQQFSRENQARELLKKMTSIKERV